MKIEIVADTEPIPLAMVEYVTSAAVASGYDLTAVEMSTMAMIDHVKATKPGRVYESSSPKAQGPGGFAGTISLRGGEPAKLTVNRDEPGRVMRLYLR